VVAHVLGLKLRLLANTFRRSTWQLVGLIIGLLYGFAIAIAALAALVALRVAQAEVAHVTVTVLGSAVTLGFLLLPLAFGVDDTLDPRRFSLFGIPIRKLTAALAVAAFVSIPAAVLAVVAITQIVTWSRGPLPVLFALAGAVLIVPTCILAARVTSGIASYALASRRARDATGITLVVLLALAAPTLVVAATTDWDRYLLPVVRTIASVAQWTPFGAMWSMPGQAAIGHTDRALIQLGIAVAFLGLLALAWMAIVRVLLTRPQREEVPRVYVGLGLIGKFPARPAWAIAARSFSYWMRDARYGVGLAVVPVVPILMCVALAIAGVPGEVIAWLPIPIVCLFLGWTIHNDVAYDNTAFWLHVASDVDGRADRLGRLAPPLTIGVPVAVLGSIATVWISGNWPALPGLLGVSLGLLLIGLGISSVVSARFPYPVVRPGDSPFAQPQSAGTAGAFVQSISFFATAVSIAPVAWLAWMGERYNPGYHWLALAAALVLGSAVLAIGVRAGGRIIERDGPELLAIAMRN
jgi:ABC-2 type transport system permease protein